MTEQRDVDRVADLYLDLLKGCLTRQLFPDGSLTDEPAPSGLRRLLRRRSEPAGGFEGAARAEGRDWPKDAETMIGRARLDNLHDCVADVVRRGVPGDLIETGVWRGGAVILMKGVLAAYGDTERTVWAADSFQWVPQPDPSRYPADAGDRTWEVAGVLATAVDEVRANFARYGLLDERVRFLEGWFKDTLPTAPIERLAVLRLDGDLYESTMDALRHLYPKLSPGGYVIVDDYGAYPACREAVHDYRDEHGITEPIREIDWTGAYWQRASTST